jgi:predicted nucleic acid-binding protein
MILADTSVWVDHFRKRDSELYQQLQRNNIYSHPFVVTELMLGNLPDRQKTISSLDRLPMATVAQLSEVRSMIEGRFLFQRGIGFVDAHLLASAFLTPHTAFWTRDKQLRKIAHTLGLDAHLS